MKRLLALCLAALALCVCTLVAQDKKKGGDPTRSVQGSITTPEDSAAKGAVVYLKNLKTLQVRSFVTKDDGTYYFHGLSPDIDYELRAELQGNASPVKTLSAFDSRKEAAINLKLAKK